MSESRKPGSPTTPAPKNQPTQKAQPTTKTAAELDAELEADLIAPEYTPYKSENDETATDVESLTAENYTVPEGEENLYHVLLDKPNFSPKTGQKLSVAFVQKFTAADWDAHQKHSTEGFTAVMLHDPKQ